jgi:hypothetical protein
VLHAKLVYIYRVWGMIWWCIQQVLSRCPVSSPELIIYPESGWSISRQYTLTNFTDPFAPPLQSHTMPMSCIRRAGVSSYPNGHDLGAAYISVTRIA